MLILIIRTMEGQLGLTMCDICDVIRYFILFIQANDFFIRRNGCFFSLACVYFC